MRRIGWLMLLLGWLALAWAEDGATVRVVWRKVPVPVALPVGKERLVIFPEPVRVGLPANLAPQLRTQTVDGVVYWKAGKPFGPHRVQVQGLDSGKIWLVDLSASKEAPGATLEIIDPEIAPPSDARPSGQRPKPRPLDYVALIRLAAQRLYAPRRLWRNPAGVRRVALRRRPVANLIRHHRIEAVPAASWRSGSLTVTAVRLRNLEPRPITLDPRQLRGRWRAATFQHVVLQPAGTLGDETAVYLISDLPFEEAAP